MGKRDKTLIVVTIVLLVALVFSFVWDINTFVLKRTVNVELGETMEIDTMHKYGPMIYRKAYESKIRFNPDEAENVLNTIASYSNVDPEILSYTDYIEKSKELFNSQNLKPNPAYGTEVAILKTVTKDGDYATFMIAIENQASAYLYIYFSRG